MIDHRVAAQAYAAAGRVHVYPGGSHRFEHIEEAVAEIRGSCGSSIQCRIDLFRILPTDDSGVDDLISAPSR